MALAGPFRRAADLPLLRALVAACLLATSCSGADQNVSIPMAMQPQSLASSNPMKLYVLSEMVRLANIDVLSGSFTLDAYMYFAWRDDRVAIYANDGDDISSYYQSSVWWGPQPEVMNDAEGSSTIDLGMTASFTIPDWVTPLGDDVVSANSTQQQCWVVADHRFFVVLTAVLNLQDFPFDWHDVGLAMESKVADITQLVWVPVPRLTSSFSPKSGVDGWSSVGAGATIQNQTYFATLPYSRVFLFLRLARQPTVYNLRFVMGSSLLAGMAILTVFINGGEADRLGFANACFLGIVSWQFILVSSTPALGYATRMDIYLLASLAFITFVYFYNSLHIGLWFGSHEAADAANKSPAAHDSDCGHAVVVPPEEGKQASTPHSAVPRRYRRGAAICRWWGKRPPQRKADAAVLVIYVAGYIIASAAILVGGLTKPAFPIVSIDGNQLIQM